MFNIIFIILHNAEASSFENFSDSFIYKCSVRLQKLLTYSNVSSIVLQINSADLPSPNVGVFLASDSTF